MKFELCLGLSWLTLPCLVLGSACALVFSLVLVLAWLVLGFASASSVFVFVGTRRAPLTMICQVFFQGGGWLVESSWTLQLVRRLVS